MIGLMRIKLAVTQLLNELLDVSRERREWPTALRLDLLERIGPHLRTRGELEVARAAACRSVLVLHGAFASGAYKIELPEYIRIHPTRQCDFSWGVSWSSTCQTKLRVLRKVARSAFCECAHNCSQIQEDLWVAHPAFRKEKKEKQLQSRPL